jgi:hypothetical protein
MKKLFVVLFMLFAMPAFAIDSNDVAGAGFKNLSATDKANIIAQVEQLSNRAGGNVVSTPEKVEKWVNLGASIGKGLAGAAKELGVAANDFAKTPVGEMTMFLIMWHFLSTPIIHVVGGLLVWAIGFSFILFMIRKQKRVVEYAKNDKGIVRTIEPLEDENAGAYMAAAAIVTLLGIAVIFTW